MISLVSMYIYAEYDKSKEESISGDILSYLNMKDDTTISSYENALVVKITQEASNLPDDSIEETSNSNVKVATATSTYTAPNGKKYESIGVINIPKINLTYPILSKTTDALMKVAPCKFHGGSPNEVGNLCIIAHNYRRKGVFFSDVPDLEVGDIVEIQDLSKRTVQYEVYDIHTVVEDDVSDTTQKTNGRKEVTLITCTDDSNEQRVIVRCKEKI